MDWVSLEIIDGDMPHEKCVAIPIDAPDGASAGAPPLYRVIFRYANGHPDHGMSIILGEIHEARRSHDWLIGHIGKCGTCAFWTGKRYPLVSYGGACFFPPTDRPRRDQYDFCGSWKMWDDKRDA